MPRLGQTFEAKIPSIGFNYCNINNISTDLEKEKDVYLVFEIGFANGSKRKIFISFNYERDEAGLVILNSNIKRLNSMLDLFRFKGGISAEGTFVDERDVEIPREMIPTVLANAYTKFIETCSDEFPYVCYVYTEQKDDNVFYNIWKYIYNKGAEEKFRTHITKMIENGNIKFSAPATSSQPVFKTTATGSGFQI